MTSKKAPGYDLIISEALQHASKKIIAFITSLFNAILRLTTSAAKNSGQNSADKA